MTQEPQAERDPPEGELERLSNDLKDQMRFAKERISDRYAKLMEERSFEPEAEKDES